MKSAKYLAVVLAVITMAFMLTACGNTQDDTKVDSSPSTIASEPATEETNVPETTPPSNDTYIDESTGLVINKKKGTHKEDDVSIYPVVEWAPFGDSQEVGTYTNISTINLDLFVHGFNEVTFETALNDSEFGKCEIKDVEYAFDGNRAQVRFTYATDSGSAVWELHAEHTGEERDISDIGGADPSTFFGPKSLRGGIISSYVSYYKTGYGFDSIEVYLFYSPKTGNMYSLHSDSPDGPCPSILHYTSKYLPESYFNPNAEQIEAQFTIKLGLEKKTYSYMTGMKFRNWVKSKYNTDGWKQGNGIVISPDGKYCITDDTIVSSFSEVQYMR